VNVAVFIVGAFMLIAAVMGNGYALFDEVKGQYDFLPWITAVFILYVFWEYSPAPVDKTVRLLIALAVLGYMVADYKTVSKYSQDIIDFLQSGAKAS
jgi:hypothetical protein